jgi:hypothetical protein
LDTFRDSSIREKDFSLVGFSSLSVRFEIRVSSSISWILKKDNGVLLVSKNGFDLILREFEDSWDHKWLDEVHELILVWGSSVNVDVLSLIILLVVLVILELLEISEENNLRLVFSDQNFAKAVLREMNEINLILGISVCYMSLGIKRIIGGTIVGYKELVIFIQSWQFRLHAKLELIFSLSDNIFVSRSWSESVVVSEVLDFEVSAGKLGGWWSGLLGHPLDDGVLGSSTSVLRFDTVLEPRESWETLNAESLGKSLLLGSINLCESNWWIILGKNFGSSLILWGKLLAVTAPWCVEFDEKELVLGELFIEVCVGEDQNTVIEIDGAGALEGEEGREHAD